MNWDVTWHAGHVSSKHDPAPEIQSHPLTDDLIVMRQNMSVHYEAPFMFLLIGAERALLIDTGATAREKYLPLRRTVDEHLKSRGADFPLLVAHTHGHLDHVHGDAQFTDRPNTVVVDRDLESVCRFYGFDDWPATTRSVDLGDRVVDVIPGPGHQSAATVFYDRRTGVLFTGDSIYPGKLYIQDWAAYTATIDRLVEWAQEHPVSYVVGCHIEKSTGGELYPIGTTYQPDEPPLQLPVSALTDLRDGLATVNGDKGMFDFGAFEIFHPEAAA